MKANDLHDLKPADGLAMYLTERESELRASTIKSIRSRVGMFVEWCRENDVDFLRDLDGMDLHQYRLQTADGVSRRTLACRLSDVRTFLRWGRSVEAVDPELPEKIIIPNADRARTRMLDADTASEVLDYLQRFRYASSDHVVMELFWRSGARLGAIRSLDLTDYHADTECVDFHHRPETGTPLKNGPNGERPIALSSATCLIISDYIDHSRKAQTDDSGREPLVTTTHGRISGPALRRTVYRLTRPCVYVGECPHDRDRDGCEAATSSDRASRCPSVVSPHDIRRGSITHLCRNEVPTAVISDRCDVSPKVLDKHYNQMTDREKMEQRRGYLDDL